jgi:hypothetical protein
MDYSMRNNLNIFINQSLKKMARKTEKVEKPKRSYTRRKNVSVEVIVEKPKYNWRKHLKSNNIVKSSRKNDILAELSSLMGRVEDSLHEIENETGSVTNQDVVYHIQLVNRILQHKFA